MRRLLGIFLILSGCAVAPKSAKKEYYDWKFCEYLPGETYACLSREDALKLKEALNRCEFARQKKP